MRGEGTGAAANNRLQTTAVWLITEFLKKLRFPSGNFDTGDAAAEPAAGASGISQPFVPAQTVTDNSQLEHG